MSKLVVLKPRMSEKAYAMSQDTKNNTYIFVVPKAANKQSIAASVKDQFDVTVISVAMSNTPGKAKRTFVNRRGKFIRGSRSDLKKAYVTLKEGDKLPIFDAVEEAEEKEEKTIKAVEKAAAKQAKKEEKSEKKRGILRRAPARTGTRGNR